MKRTIKPQERRFLATIILSGLCANSYYHFSPALHIKDAVDLLDRLLTVLDEPHEVK